MFEIVLERQFADISGSSVYRNCDILAEFFSMNRHEPRIFECVAMGIDVEVAIEKLNKLCR